MLDFVREHARGLVYSVLVHLAIVAGLVLSVARFTQPAAAPMRVVPVIQSSVVDMSEVNRQVREQELAAQQARERKATEERRAREEEQARQIALKKKQDQETRQAKLKAEAEKKQQADLLIKKKAEEKAAREKAEAEKLRVAEQKRKAEEARKAKLEADRKAEAARKQKEAEARQKAEAEAILRQNIADEEARMAAERSGLLAQYKGMISQKIERNWIRPPSARPGLECVVEVSQIPGGQVISVKVVRCNGDDTVVRSVEAAVYQASPLPNPPDPSLFERKLQLVFKPTD